MKISFEKKILLGYILNLMVVIALAWIFISRIDEERNPALDKVLDGFGEIFRWLSYADIQTSTIQSRAISGVANGTYIFCLPGSSSACRMAWDSLIQAQLDSRTRPCNLVQLMPRLLEK